MVEGFCPLDLRETKPTIGGSWDGRDTSLIYVRPRTLHNHFETVETGSKPGPNRVGSYRTPMSAVVAQAGNIIAEVIDDLQETGTEGIIEEDDGGQDDNVEEARKKKYGKKKKKHIQKLMGLMMLIKAKIGLLLQLISTHFQLKFFVIAVISLILNAVRFWIEIKKNQPSKVIYYEHAQHQHHYDHEDHDWGRSSNETPQNLAYRAYVPTK
ncbi:hypothetical protein EAG_06125 [Camponotus floridanus]|uniref:Uncharacterized protein n=1 Tax=Camponotus floridanus TaxID=104421 RepID=E2A1D9_CAMFO|nr:hypothetical protein EAG_06125 [Camponotus floridanus]